MKVFISLTAAFLLSSVWSRGQILQLFAPDELGTGRTTFSFDDFPDSTPANSLFGSYGITFSRDDGGVVPIIDYSYYERQTVSGSNILGTPIFPFIGATQGFTPHLVVNSLQPITAVGAFFGNDAFFSDFGFQRLSIYGISNQLLGSIDVGVNNNANVDQFIGVRSDIPFYSIRFENITPSGDISSGRAIGIDDFMFTTGVPEPSTWALLGMGSVCGWILLRRRPRH